MYLEMLWVRYSVKGIPYPVKTSLMGKESGYDNKSLHDSKK